MGCEEDEIAVKRIGLQRSGFQNVGLETKTSEQNGVPSVGRAHYRNIGGGLAVSWNFFMIRRST
jgi:hypothetical protein